MISAAECEKCSFEGECVRVVAVVVACDTSY